MMYTANPLEAETKQTTPTAKAVYDLLVEQWGNELNEEGCLSLTAQFWHETGGGRYCFNWNLGNIKALDSVPHMYLRNVWELYRVRSEAQKAATSALATFASAELIAKKGWGCPPGCTIVVFQPPHGQCRFRSYASLSEGAAKWVEHHRKIAAKDPDYLPNLNAGNLTGAAHDLREARYYTGDEGGYARAMLRARETVLKLLG
jgi:hypothetical protein